MTTLTDNLELVPPFLSFGHLLISFISYAYFQLYIKKYLQAQNFTT